MPLQKIGGDFFGDVGQSMLSETNHKAGHTDLRADIKKLSNDAFHQVLIPQDRPMVPGSGFRLPLRPGANLTDFRQPRKVKQARHKQEKAGDPNIPPSDTAALTPPLTYPPFSRHARQPLSPA